MLLMEIIFWRSNMIHIDKNTRIPSVEETLGTLRMYNSLMPQFVDFDKLMMLLGYLQIQIEKISKPLFGVIGAPAKIDAANNMKSWIYRYSDPSLFEPTKDGISLSKASVDGAFETGCLSEDAQLLIRTYQKYANLTKARGTLVSLLQNPMSDMISCDGHKMLIIRPEWASQNTGRVAMRNPAIQNIPRELQEIITVPKGFVLLHTDSGQVEPRIIYSAYINDPQIKYLINLYDDAYFGVLHYVTMSDEERNSGRTDFKKMEITESMQANRKSIKTYSNAVMYGSKSNSTGDPIKAAMIKYIGSHPLRLQWVDNLMSLINNGQTVFKTAFGTPIDTSKSPKLEDGNMHSGSLSEQKLKLAINNPIQGTAADLMRISVGEANKILMNRAKKSYIVNYVHDAGTFAIHEDEYDNIAKDLGDIVSYDIEGWLPIKAEPEFGRDNGKKGLIEDLY